MRPNKSSILRALPGAENLLDRAEGGSAPGNFSGGPSHPFLSLLKNARTFPRNMPFSTSPRIRSSLLHIAFRKYFIPITPLFSKFFIIPLSFVKGVTGLPAPNEIRAAKCAVSCAAAAIAEYAAELLQGMGLSLEEKQDWDGTREQIRFKELSDAEKAELVKKDPRYGRVICRCETITEGEIVTAIHSPIPPCSVDGIKRRAGAGMGRCQGGFCGPRVVDILSRELGISPLDIRQDGDGTYILTGTTKGGDQA